LGLEDAARPAFGAGERDEVDRLADLGILEPSPRDRNDSCAPAKAGFLRIVRSAYTAS